MNRHVFERAVYHSPRPRNGARSRSENAAWRHVASIDSLQGRFPSVYSPKGPFTTHHVLERVRFCGVRTHRAAAWRHVASIESLPRWLPSVYNPSCPCRGTISRRESTKGSIYNPSHPFREVIMHRLFEKRWIRVVRTRKCCPCRGTSLIRTPPP